MQQGSVMCQTSGICGNITWQQEFEFAYLYYQFATVWPYLINYYKQAFCLGYINTVDYSYVVPYFVYYYNVQGTHLHMLLLL